MNTCLNCGKEVKNKFCNTSCQNKVQAKNRKFSKEHKEKIGISKKSKNKKFIVNCFKCEGEFEIEEYNVTKPKKEKYYCSRSCANSRTFSEESKKKKRISAKNSEKVAIANKINAKNRLGICYRKNSAKKAAADILSKCLLCEKDIIHKHYKKRKYHKECWLKLSGGIKKGSSRGKCGWYNGYWCDSSYELAWIIYNIEHNISFKRNNQNFDYIFHEKVYKYYPDFILSDGSYVEIKNYKSDLTDAKISQFPFPIKVIYRKEMEEIYLPYVISKYGKNFITLYKN